MGFSVSIEYFIITASNDIKVVIDGKNLPSYPLKEDLSKEVLANYYKITDINHEWADLEQQIIYQDGEKLVLPYLAVLPEEIKLKQYDWQSLTYFVENNSSEHMMELVAGLMGSGKISKY